jgi:hypothetical protein
MPSHAFKTSLASHRPDCDDFKNPDFDLRDILAATTVEELSFAEFLAVLQQTGRPPR